MKNLEQIRAKNALDAAGKYDFKGKNDGAVVKKVPAMIQQNGLLGAIAFAMDDNAGHADVLNSCREHCNQFFNRSDKDLGQWCQWLCSEDSAILRAVTEEVMAFLTYLRRYV